MRFAYSQCTQLLLRLTLYGGEVYKAPRATTLVRVRSGVAWITHGGADMVLPAGGEAALTSPKDFALVSPLGKNQLVVELLGHERSMSHRVSGTPVHPHDSDLTPRKDTYL